jgi:hypothetical protein
LSLELIFVAKTSKECYSKSNPLMSTKACKWKPPANLA